MTGENIAKTMLEILTEYDFKHVTQKKLQQILEDDKHKYLGAWTKNPKGIYLLKGHKEELTILHEFGHAYLDKIGVEVTEEKTDELAQEWKRIIDGVYCGK